MRRILSTLIFLIITVFCFGQISTEEQPYSWRNYNLTKRTYPENLPTFLLPKMDMEKIKEEDRENELYGYPTRIGYPNFVNLSLKNSGLWTWLLNGDKLWRLKIKSEDALFLDVQCEKFWLPEGAKFFIYSSDSTQVMGAYTALNNKGNKIEPKGFGIGSINAKEIILEYYEPRGVEEGIIEIRELISGYRSSFGTHSMLRHNNTDLSCHVDVKCITNGGDLYENNINAVVHIKMSGYICSGALINTTAEDGRPYLLTANHCFINDPERWVFYFHYEAPFCGGIASPDYSKSVSGAKILASAVNSDFLLVELLEDPAGKASITPFYAGWDRGTVTSSASGIHHPNGAQKKISIDWDPPVIYNSALAWQGGPNTPARSHWKVEFDQSNLEGGSSGSPLFNGVGRIIGQAHGGTIECPPRGKMYYGMLSYSWDKGGSSSTQLKNWLDPLNTGTSALNGRPEGCWSNLTISEEIRTSQTIKGCDIILSSKITNRATVLVKSGATVTLKNGFVAENGTTVNIKAGLSWQDRQNARSKSENGSFYKQVEEVSTSSVGINSEQNETISYLLQNRPNPFRERTTIQCYVPEEARNAFIRVFDVYGLTVRMYPIETKGSSEIDIEKIELSKGMYLYSLIIDGKLIATKKMNSI